MLDADSAQEMVMAQDEMGFDGSLAPFDFAFPAHRARSALPPKADIGEHDGNVRFVPKRTLGGASVAKILATLIDEPFDDKKFGS